MDNTQRTGEHMMLKTGSNLLTQEDFDLIRREGAPSLIPKNLVHFLPRGQVFITERGVAFYKEAVRAVGLSADVEHITTSEALMTLTVKIRLSHEAGPSKPSGKPVTRREGNVVHVRFGLACA